MSVGLMNDGAGGESTSGGEGGAASGSTSGGSSGTSGGEGQAAGGDGAGAAVTGTAGGEAAENPYTLNSKFKYPDPASLDKHVQLEGEIDPFFHSLITDAESEKKVKELYEKAYGLDSVKPRFQKQGQELREARQQIASINQTIQEMGEAYNRGDLDTVFKIMNIPEEKLLQHLVNKINYSKLPEDQRQAIDARRAAELEAQSASKQYQSLEAQHREALVQHRQLALTVALQEPAVTSYAQAFDAARGAGSFKKAVCERGELAWHRSNGATDLTPEQAIQEVMAFFGAPTSAAQTAVPSATGQPASPAQKPQVIPNLEGRGGASPMSKPRPKSIEDLKKLASSM